MFYVVSIPGRLAHVRRFAIPQCVAAGATRRVRGLGTLPMLRAALALLLVVATPAGSAAEREHDDVARSLSIENPDRFAASAQRVRSEMGLGGRYALIPGHERDGVELRLRRIEAVFARSGPAHEPSPDQRLELQGLRSEIVDLLTPYENPRIACETKPNLGCAFR
jgi:hypothetical protein